MTTRAERARHSAEWRLSTEAPVGGDDGAALPPDSEVAGDEDVRTARFYVVRQRARLLADAARGYEDATVAASEPTRGDGGDDPGPRVDARHEPAY